MLKTKDLIIKPDFNRPLPLIHNQFTLRLRKGIYFINHPKILKAKKNSSNFKIEQINLDLLTIFYTVVILGSLSKAAKSLCLSQPAISLSLQKIEKELGFLLFKQVGPKMSIVLSPAGLILFNYVQRLFQITEESLKFSNLNLFQTDLDNIGYKNIRKFNLLTALKKNKSVFLSIQSPLMRFIAKKEFFNFKKFFFCYENESRFIILQRKLKLSDQPFISNKKNSLSNFFIMDKVFSFKKFNNQVYSTLTQNNFVEIQTINAHITSFDMKISDCIYWGK